MHHSSDDLPEAIKREIFKPLASAARIADQPKCAECGSRGRHGSHCSRYIAEDPYLKVGATGNFPQGKLTDNDEGEIAFGIAADVHKGKVLVNFGKPVVWFGMDAKQARELAAMLISKAYEIDGLPESVGKGVDLAEFKRAIVEAELKHGVESRSREDEKGAA